MHIVPKILFFCLYLNSISSYLTEKQRVLNEYIDTFEIQCPLVSKPNNEKVQTDSIYWINENLSFNKIDQDVNIPDNLIDKGKANIKVSPGLNYVSCGYLFNNVFVRIKLWNIVFVEIPTINLNVKNNSSKVYYNKVNDTTSSISISSSENVNSWTQAYDLIRFKCVTNYDIPCDTKYVWMYFYNPVTCAYEIWHKNDGNETVENIYQIFINERYQSVTSKSAPLSDFLRYVLVNQITSIQFQCASYYLDQYLIATSQNLSIIHGDYFPTTLFPTSSPASVIRNENNGVLIGAIIGSILGFLAFLALLLCLIYCCCCYKKRRNRNQNVKITNNQNLSTRSTVSMYPSEAHEIGRQSYQNTTIHSRHSTVPIAYLPSASTHTVDKITQFNNQIDMSHNLALSSSCSSNQNLANIRTIAPEVYLKMITVTKDVNEDVSSIHNEAYKYDIQQQQQQQQYPRGEICYSDNGEAYIPDESFYSQRKEYIIHNIQQQQHQQNEIAVHYV